MVISNNGSPQYLRDQEEQDVGDQLAPGRPVSPSLARESLIIFDWDDTILPTSWLERIHALTASQPVRPEVQRQLSNLATVCAQTISMATQLAKVVIITNSAPGWVDQSCHLFMPWLSNLVRSFQIFAKPMNAPLTFKTSTFRRECKVYRNVVSVGDGEAERAASLRLQAPSNRKCITGLGGDFGDSVPSRVKSVKLMDLPTCTQLISQHEMLQARLADVVAFEGSMDLKSRFAASGFGGSPAMPPGRSSTQTACQLVHLGRPTKDTSVRESSAPITRPPPMIDEGAAARLQAERGAFTPRFEGSSPLRERPSPVQLPVLGGLGGSREGVSGDRAAEQVPSERGRTLPAPSEADKTEIDAVDIRLKMQSISDSGSPRSPYHGFGKKRSTLVHRTSAECTAVAPALGQHSGSLSARHAGGA